jgi:hypothetical protein
MHGGATFSGIIGAAGALEAYVSEIAAHQVQVRLLTEMERTSIRKEKEVPKKFRLLLESWALPDFHGQTLYLDLCALFALRNCLVHRSADFLTPGEWPEKLKPYQGRIPHVQGTGLDWTSQVLDADTAAWALLVARRVLKLAGYEVPDPGVLGMTHPPPTRAVGRRRT